MSERRYNGSDYSAADSNPRTTVPDATAATSRPANDLSPKLCISLADCSRCMYQSDRSTRCSEVFRRRADYTETTASLSVENRTHAYCEMKVHEGAGVRFSSSHSACQSAATPLLSASGSPVTTHIDRRLRISTAAVMHPMA